jgi:hypothetical protein
MSILATESLKLAINILAAVEVSPLDVHERAQTVNIVGTMLIAREFEWNAVAIGHFGRTAAQLNFELNLSAAHTLNELLNLMTNGDPNG